MSVDKLVDSTQLNSDLTSVANAIRTRGGTSAQLSFPNEFISAVQNIGDGYTMDEICAVGFPAITGNVIFTGTRIRPALFKNNTNITSFIGNNVTSLSDANYGTGAEVRTFEGCTNLISVTFPLITSLDRSDYLFSGCTNLETANFNWENMTGLGTGVFYNCPALTKTVYVLPKVTSNVWANFLTANTYVTAFDIGNASISLGSSINIRANAFVNDTNLNTLILRNTNTIRKLETITAFNGTPFASNGSGGTLYVPSALISDYQSATNWSTILAYTNNQIVAIEGSIYETKYADGTTIPVS